MKRVNRKKKLTLHNETLRQLTQELTEPQLAKVLGGDSDFCDGCPLPSVPSDTCFPSR